MRPKATSHQQLQDIKQERATRTCQKHDAIQGKKNLPRVCLPPSAPPSFSLLSVVTDFKGGIHKSCNLLQLPALTGEEHETRELMHARQPKQNVPCVAGLRRLPLPEADVSEEPEEAALAGVNPSASTTNFRAELRLVRFFL